MFFSYCKNKSGLQAYKEWAITITSKTKAVEIGRKAGVNMDGEVSVGKVGDLLDDVLKKYKPKKQQKGGRRKRELLWETSSGTTSHWRSGDHGWLGLMQYKVFHGTKLFVICVLL